MQDGAMGARGPESAVHDSWGIYIVGKFAIALDVRQSTYRAANPEWGVMYGRVNGGETVALLVLRHRHRHPRKATAEFSYRWLNQISSLT